MSYILFFLSIFLFGGIILKLNILTPLFSDDFTYSLIFGTSERIKSIYDLVESQYIHYYAWGGRTVGHTIVQVLLLLKPIYTDIVNTIAYLLLTCIIYIHSIGVFQVKKVYLFFLLNILVWFFVPAFSETILWITGSGNYMWCTLIVLIFLLPYRLYNKEKIEKNKYLFKSICLFVGGVLAGWSNENLGIAVIIMVLCFIFIIKKTHNIIPLWAVSGLIGVIVGYLFLVLAPGNYVRAGDSLPALTPFYIYLKFNITTSRLIDKAGFLVLLSFILFIIGLKFNFTKRSKYQAKVAFVFFIGCLVSFYSMTPSSSFPDRAMFGGVIFCIIILGISITTLNLNVFFIRIIFYGVFFSFSGAFVFDFYRSYKDVKAVNREWIERDVILQEALTQNLTDTIYIPSVVQGITKYSMGDASFASSSMSRYYKAKIKIVEE